MLAIAIDGACRRNGKPDCVSAGGVFVAYLDEEGNVVDSYHTFHSEKPSTNQRGEMHALIKALQYISINGDDAQIITDSEYLFNAMTNHWVERWVRNGWTTASGESVKNADLWQRVLEVYSSIKTEVTFYHIKGHVIPFGKVTAQRLLDGLGGSTKLYNAIYDKVVDLQELKKEAFEYAQDLSKKNNGFELPNKVLRRFIASNIVADAVATKGVEYADRNI